MSQPKQPGLTVASAAAELGYDPRHIRRLVKAGRLKAVGTGPGRRITRESMAAFCVEQPRKVDMSVAMSYAAGPSSQYKRFMRKMFQRVPPLSNPRDAAKALGLPPAQLEQLIATGDIPVVVVGAQQFVPAHWLMRTMAQALGVGLGTMKIGAMK